MSKQHGFTLIKEKSLQEVGGLARLWQHENGARLLSICNEDENKCFSINFRTPPINSTGVAHILEHSVLCGSKKYPVREPFVELLKGSLQTFLNAMTFPDKTCYPVASTNRQDFYNLIDVYMDAVLNPLITEATFQQEGWHLEAENPDGPWQFRGVVYNEMKGVYSSPDSQLAEASQHAVFPDNIYNVDSGGDPEVITSLTYADFIDFHKRYYHPSNSWVFFWGDDPEEERLKILNKYFANYQHLEVNSQIELQPLRDTPMQVELPYPAHAGAKAHFAINWLLPEHNDLEKLIIFEMLGHLLEGLPGSPLRRALIASGLGEDLTGGGLDDNLRQMYYSTGLKGIAPEDIQKAKLLIFETLASLAEGGFDPLLVKAAINSVEFQYRENNSGRFPRGLAAMIQAMSTWLYDQDPFDALAWEKPLEKVKARLAKGERVFEEYVRKYFLENKHHAVVILLPDTELEAQKDAKEKAILAKILAESDAKKRQEVVAQTAKLHEIQERPDSPEALATIPNLSPADLNKEGQEFPLAEDSKFTQNAKWIEHDLPTKGIAYSSLLFPLDSLDDDVFDLLPLFSRSLTQLGTAKHDFITLGAEIAAYTGGMGASPSISLDINKKTIKHFTVASKAVRDSLPEQFRLLQEILTEPQKDPEIYKQRLKEMLLEDKSRLEHGLVGAGHHTASLRLGTKINPNGSFGERLGGLSALRNVEKRIEQLAKDPDSFIADLERIRKAIFQQNCLVNCTADQETLPLVKNLASKLIDSLPVAKNKAAVEHKKVEINLPEAIIAKSQVNYVAKGANLYDLGYKFNGNISVILRSLRMGWLWEQVRVKGGAYGASCSFSRLSGALLFSSYRDPNVLETLAAFDGAAKYLHDLAVQKSDIDKAIVGTIGDIDAYLLPDAKGALSFTRWLIGESKAERAKIREEIFATKAQDFRDFAEILDAVAKSGQTCVLGGLKLSEIAKEKSWTETPLLTQA